ncbi:hypothetical protein SEA_FINKLE_72 [Gordonia phage Finkle]|uniref:Uncharacterized protein n=1 Tax=Gordonia phage Finkle TaxID=2926099 RepID=A0A9E7NJJ1_9CAUD|nr:hypothetical protein QEH33_gp72 [Gordonia phage Finkle]UTN92986.1 hypothetical protein SEA_FINKLE_72 [Gordonia phage Finkle]
MSAPQFAQDVIGRAIHEHDANASMGGVEWPTWDELDDEGRAAYESVGEAVLDALTAAGFAVVKLPEPDHRCDRDSAWITPGDEYYQVDYDRRTGVYVSDRTTTTGQVFGPVTPSEGRAIAAALLAAHAEAGEERG